MAREERKYRSGRERAESRESGFESKCLKLPKGVKQYKLKKGVHRLDIIPYVVGKGNPCADEGEIYYERTYFNHRGIGPNQDSYVCLAKTINEPCPMCELERKLRKEGGMDEDDLKQMRPKERQIFQIIDTKDRDAGIQILEASNWVFGKAIDEAIKMDEDDEQGWAMFFHPQNGFTLKISVIDEKMGSTSFAKVNRVDFLPRKPYKDTIIEEGYCLDELLAIESYKTLKKALMASGEKEADGDDDNEEDDDDAPPAKKSKASKHTEDEDDDQSDDEDDQDDEPKNKKKGSAKASEDDDDGADDDDEPPAKTKKSSKKDEDEDDDDGEGDEDDEDEPSKPAAKTKKKAVDEDDEEPAPKKKKAKDDDDDDADDDEPVAKKKSSKKEEDDDDDDWDDEDEDDEDEDEPKAKSKKKDEDDD